SPGLVLGAASATGRDVLPRRDHSLRHLALARQGRTVERPRVRPEFAARKLLSLGKRWRRDSSLPRRHSCRRSFSEGRNSFLSIVRFNCPTAQRYSLSGGQLELGSAPGFQSTSFSDEIEV